jgi:hypothetical protein
VSVFLEKTALINTSVLALSRKRTQARHKSCAKSNSKVCMEKKLVKQGKRGEKKEEKNSYCLHRGNVTRDKSNGLPLLDKESGWLRWLLK